MRHLYQICLSGMLGMILGVALVRDPTSVFVEALPMGINVGASYGILKDIRACRAEQA